jgi:hypothetical protein
MPKDVYADDEALGSAAAASSSERVADFSIIADADPDVLLRLAAILNLLNVAPRAFRLETVDGTATVRALVDGCTELQADYAARKLRQLTCVHSVELHAER